MQVEEREVDMLVQGLLVFQQAQKFAESRRASGQELTREVGLSTLAIVQKRVRKKRRFKVTAVNGCFVRRT